MKNKILLLLTMTLLLGTSAQAQKKFRPNERRFVYMSSLNFSAGVGQLKFDDRSIKNDIPTIQVDQLLAYQFNSHFFMGVGAGINVWKYTAFIPLYLNVSVNFMKTKITPHWYANMGYAFKWYVESRPEKMTKVINGAVPGPYGETGLGIHVKITDKVGILVLAHYRMLYSSVKYSTIGGNEVDFSQYATNRAKNVLYHFAGVRLGILY
ncbi:MAG: hypothetical protein RR034_05155 [Bacteroidales bacterium]